MRPVLVAIVLLASAAFAGCSAAPSKPVQTASAGDAPTSATPAPGGGSAPTPPSSSSASPSDPSGSPAPALNGSSTPVASSIPISIKGTAATWVTACGFTPAYGFCDGTDAPTSPRTANNKVLAFTGRLTGGSVTLTFTPSGAAPQQLAVEALLEAPGSFKVLAEKAGDSPVTLTLPPTDVGPDQMVILYVYSLSQGEITPAGGVVANPGDVPFELKGAAQVEALPEPATKDVPYKFEGSFPTFVEPCVTFVGCQDAPPGVAFKNLDQPTFTGKPMSATLTMEWTAATPATQTLGYFVYATNDKNSFGLGGASGESPLKVDVPKVTLPAGYRLAVRAYIPDTWAAAGWATANPMDQPFTISGTWKVTA